MTQYVILDGNPLDGYSLYGPFDNENEAMRFADDNLDYGREWHITKLIEPKGE